MVYQQIGLEFERELFLEFVVVHIQWFQMVYG